MSWGGSRQTIRLQTRVIVIICVDHPPGAPARQHAERYTGVRINMSGMSPIIGTSGRGFGRAGGTRRDIIDGADGGGVAIMGGGGRTCYEGAQYTVEGGGGFVDGCGSIGKTISIYSFFLQSIKDLFHYK